MHEGVLVLVGGYMKIKVQGKRYVQESREWRRVQALREMCKREAGRADKLAVLVRGLLCFLVALVAVLLCHLYGGCAL